MLVNFYPFIICFAIQYLCAPKLVHPCIGYRAVAGTILVVRPGSGCVQKRLPQKINKKNEHKMKVNSEKLSQHLAHLTAGIGTS